MGVYIYHSTATTFAASCKINLGVLNITNKSITITGSILLLKVDLLKAIARFE